MNFLSFDVGIINLAYCILTPEKKIIHWGIINLNKNPICDVTLRKKCQKQASYTVIDEDIQYFIFWYCFSSSFFALYRCC